MEAERLDSPRSRGRFATSRAQNRDLRCNRLFVVVGSLVAVSRGPLTRRIIHDRKRPSKSAGQFPSNQSKEIVWWRVDHEKHKRHESPEISTSKSQAGVRASRQNASEQSSRLSADIRCCRCRRPNSSLASKVHPSVLVRIWASRKINGPGCQALEFGADERYG